MSPQGSFVVLTKALKHLAKGRSARALKAYVEGATFVQLLATIRPERRRTALALLAKAEAACRIQLPAPTGARRANWRDLAFRAKFCNAYARGMTDEEAAQHCQITLSAAKAARRRYVEAPATPIARAA